MKTKRSYFKTCLECGTQYRGGAMALVCCRCAKRASMVHVAPAKKWTARKVDMGPLGLAFEIIDPDGKETGVMGGGSDADLLKRVRSRLRDLNRKAEQ